MSGAGLEHVAALADRIDALVTRIDGLLELRGNNAITVTHTQAGNMGFYGGVAVACCVATVVLMIAFMIVENRSYTHLDAQMDQLRAWSDVHGKEIARLQAQRIKE